MSPIGVLMTVISISCLHVEQRIFTVCAPVCYGLVGEDSGHSAIGLQVSGEDAHISVVFGVCQCNLSSVIAHGQDGDVNQPPLASHGPDQHAVTQLRLASLGHEAVGYPCVGAVLAFGAGDGGPYCVGL